MSDFRVEVDQEGNPFSPEVSMAISLKRIAEALEKLLQPPVMVELSQEDQEEFERSANVMFNQS